MEQPASLPTMDTLTKVTYTMRDWLMYYKNIWTRNATARLIDVQCDIATKAKNPEELVDGDDGRPIQVKVRLEMRKMALEQALELIGNIDATLSLNDEQLTALYSPDALKVAADMLPPEPKAGDICTTFDGKSGTLGDQNGMLICVPTEAVDTTKDVAAADQEKVADAATDEAKI